MDRDRISNESVMQQSLDLQYILNLFDVLEFDIHKLLQILGFHSIEQLNQSLQQSLILRQHETNSHQYILQASSIGNSLSYLFSPFIGAVLNLTTVYIAQKESTLEEVYPHYFRLDAVHLEKQRSMQEMHLSLDLVADELDAKEFLIYALCRALLDSHCQHIMLVGDAGLEGIKREAFTQITHISFTEIAPIEDSFDFHQIDLKKLFWKKKSDDIADVCRGIAKANAPLVSQQFNIQLDKAQHLIDDLLYGEHIFEKLSVFGEFTETIFKHHTDAK